jgi:copper chaperone CopZ
VTNKTYQIEGMHCQSCIQKITDALQGFAESVQVTLNPPRAVLKNPNTESLDELNQAVAKVGSYRLTPQAEIISANSDEEKKSWLATYYPLFLIVGLISVVSLKGAGNAHEWMLHFMAGFFIVFSFFKLLDMRGFADAYSTYDLLAKRWHGYGFIYPFLELGLGLAFLFGSYLTQALWFSIVLMGFSSLGVIQALTEKRKIRCACLGTVLNLPMSTITLVEDLGMVAMSVFMLMSLN